MDPTTDLPVALQGLLSRRSASPRCLIQPGVGPDELSLAIRAGLRAPDHGGLTPWRLLSIPPERRSALGRLFALEKKRRNPLATPDDLDRAAVHSTGVPTLLAFVVCPRPGSAVPLHEQWLAAGAALGNILNALAALGYGAVMLSGERCADPWLSRALGIGGDEILAGFLSAGTVQRPPTPAPERSVAGVWSTWAGAPQDPVDT